MSSTQKIFKDSIPWVRLAICANIHIKKALLKVLHNDINDNQVTGLPSNPKDLYLFLQTKKSIIQNSKHIKKEQKSILLPTSTQSVNSSLLDISLIRWLIQNFCNIKNAFGNWQEPSPADQTLCANVYRAAHMRNKIFHHDDVETLDEPTFETMWKEMKDILKGLNYTVHIEPMRTETLDISKLQGEILQEFRDHLTNYKREISKQSSQEFFIQRRFSVDKNKTEIVTSIDKLIIDNDQLNICADAGLGKSVTARNIKCGWAKGKILNDFFLLFFDSKQINQQLQYNSFAAPLFFSELGNYLRKKGKTERNFDYFDCVRTTIDNLIIIIDGIDEFPIQDLVTATYISELEKKVKNNDKISAADTINAIYFGFLFPHSKICLLGRVGEFEQLKKFKVKHDSTIFNKKSRKIKELELLKFNDANVKSFTCFKICEEQPNQRQICKGTCQDIYEKIKKIKLCKIPTDLNSLIKLHKQHPNENIGRITRTKLIIATLFNRLNEHTHQKSYFTCKTFSKMNEQKDKSKFLECFRILGEISFNNLLEGRISVKVDKETINGIAHYIYDNEIKIESKDLEELDLFYIHDFVYYFVLKPHHTLNIEFLSACYLFSHPDKWNSILKLNKDRQLAIISFLAGLHTSDYFTKDFVSNVLKCSDYSIKNFFSWLYDVEDIFESDSGTGCLPNGGRGFMCWYGLMENQRLFPSFFLLDAISQELEIPQSFIPGKTIVCHDSLSFEWYNLKYFKHNIITRLSDELNIKDFLDKFPRFDFVIKVSVMINNNDEFTCLNDCGIDSHITFRINKLGIYTLLSSPFTSSFVLNSLHIGEECDSRTIDFLLNAISPAATTSPNIFPTIQCKRVVIENIRHFNAQQTERLLALGLSDIEDSISLSSTFFDDQQIEILKEMERNHTNKVMNIELYGVVEFSRIIDLPTLGNRHLSLDFILNVTNNDLIHFRQHISPGYSNNLSNYKIIHPNVPFVRKNIDLQECKQSMYLNMHLVDLKQVSPGVFANTISMIPSLSCLDLLNSIPSSHWLELSHKKDCQINEMRIWRPKSKNFQNFLDIKTNILQFICSSKDDLKDLLNHIVKNSNIQLGRKIKVFVVIFDLYDWNYYNETTLFSGKTIKDYKNNYTSDNLLLDNVCVPFYEGEQHLNWCCEISLPLKKNSYLLGFRLTLGLALMLGLILSLMLGITFELL